MNHIIGKYGELTGNELFLNFDSDKELSFRLNEHDIRDNHLVSGKDENVVSINNKEYCLFINGYILNDHNLFEKYNTKDWCEIITTIRFQRPNDWVTELEGNFSLFFLDKADYKLELYTNITTSKPVFYFFKNNTIYFATNFIDLKNLIKLEKLETGELNHNAIYYFLIFGYYPSKYTCFENIFKLCGGEFLTFKRNTVTVKSYWNLTSEPYVDLKYDELLYELNARFDNAVKSGFEKNIRNKKSTYVTLSGGLDSRMVALSANKQGYDFETYTFSIDNSWDKIIAQEISKKISKKNTFIDLGKGEYLDDYNELIYQSGGTVGFQAAAHSLYALKELDLKNSGLVMTGQVGDAIVGDTLNYFSNHSKYNSDTIEMQYKLRDNKLFDKIKPFVDELAGNYINSEIYNYYNWVFNNTMSGDYIAGSLTEYYSPFLNSDFLGFLNRVNPQVKKDHKLYFDWIKRYYPKTKNYFYQKTERQTIWENSIHQKLQRIIKYQYYVRCRSLYNKIMLPNESWANINREMMENFIKDSINILPNELYLTLLSVIKEKSSSKMMNLFTLVKVIAN